MTDTTDLNQITRVTRYFDRMQGLRIVPFGVFLAAAWLNGKMQGGDGNLPLALLLFSAALFGLFAADKYYKNTFGSVKQRKTAVQLTQLLVVTGLILLANHGDASLQWPVSLSGLAVAGLSFIVWMTTSRFRHQYLALALVITAVSLSPLLLGNWLNPGLWDGDSLLMLALVIIIGGGIDHMLLMRALPNQPEEIA